jgi:putative pyruvate formate lyase activating enzyme
MPKLYPAYLNAAQDGTLTRIAKLTFQMLESCSLCPRKCKVNRLKGKTGFCKIALNPVVYSSLPHHGEEPPISGQAGSGTIFFSGCNMRCVYCQNYEFSQKIEGKISGPEELSDSMLKLQALGCHNINLVTPTHVMPQIIQALALAIPKGLAIPLVYNTGGYELAEIIKLLDGIVDIYLADMRYADNTMAQKFSSAADYVRFNQEAAEEMHKQAGIAEFDDTGVIKKGLIIRHLVLPNNISGTDKIMKFIAVNISKDTYISLMSQYTPYHEAAKRKEIGRRITQDEYMDAQNIMQGYGLHNGWTQEAYGLDRFAGENIKSAFSEKL